MLIQFRFDGRRGRLEEGDFVLWGGMSFHLSSAGPELRAAIDAAVHPVFEPILEKITAPRIMVEVPRVSVEETIKALQEAEHLLSRALPETCPCSITYHRIAFAVAELKKILGGP